MEPLKNVFNKIFLDNFADKIRKFDKNFKKDEYIDSIMKNLEKLELKERMRLISSSINSFTSLDYEEIITVLIKVKKDMSSDQSMSLASLVLPDYVELYGLENLELSLNALEEFTKKSSSELAIRHFIIKYEKNTMKQMLIWAKSSNEDIRRLASEGSRPRLPWAISLPIFKKDPKKVFEILEILKNDNSMYVRKSVANNLNDISKDNENLVINFVKDNISINKNLDWILKHGSRTLLKKGNKQVLEYFGFKEKVDLKLENFDLSSSVKMGEELIFSFDLSSINILDALRIEFEIDFVRLNNKRGKKVFMISQSIYKTKTKTINKKYSFKKITTRKYYKGEHFLSIIINGKRIIVKSFNLY